MTTSLQKNDKETIHVACNIDGNYTKYCAVFLVSLFESNAEERFNIHIIADGLPQETQDLLSEIAARFGNEITFHLNVGHLLEGCPHPVGKTQITITAYYRCFLDRILPETISKVLYFDVDIIVCDNIRPLWDTDISRFSLGAVEDMYSNKDSKYERLGIPKKFLYFNSGVLLVNLDYWRKVDNWSNCFKLIIEGHEIHKNHDQDVLNRLHHETKTFLPFRWNMQDGFFRKKRKVRPEIWAELDRDIKTPAVVHYTGSKKPWHYVSFHPYKQLYFKYLDKTPWKGERPKPTMEQRWKYLTYCLSAALGLKNGYLKISPLNK